MTRQIVVEIVGDSKGFAKATQEATGHAQKFGGAMSGLAAGLGLGLFNAASSAIMGFTSQIIASGQAFRDDQVSLTELKNTLTNTIPGWNGNTEGIEKYVAGQAKLGFGAKDVRNSLALLSGVTHNVAEAQRDETLAQELARAKGLDLATATMIITKAHEGNAKALKSLGIQATTTTAHVDALKASHGKHTVEELKAAAAADKVETAQAALAAIYKNTKNAAEAYASTSEGKLAAAQAKNEASWVKIGAVVNRLQSVILPLLADAFENITDKIAPTIEKVQDFMQHSDLAQPIIYGVAAALGVLGVVILSTVIPALIATVVAALPLILVIAAIALAVTVLKYAWDHNLGDIQGKAKTVFAFVKAVIEAIGPTMSALSTKVHSIWSTIVAVIRGSVNAIVDAIDNVIRGIDAMKVPDWVPGIGGKSAHLPLIPRLHSGGIVPGSPGQEVLTLLQAGERVTPAGRSGGNTLIINLPQGMILDGPALDRLGNMLIQRVNFASGT